MRNLRIIALDEVIINEKLPLSATAWDTTNDSVICAFGPTEDNQVIQLQRRKRQTLGRFDEAGLDFTKITSWDSPSPLPDLPCDEIVLLHYFANTLTCCLVLAGGDIIVVRENASADQEKIEIVGSVDAGISAAVWAPGEEILAIVTRADSLILMSKTFEPLNERWLSPDDLKTSKQVSVGWGKKETQFQGKRARALRDPTIPEVVDEGTLSSFDDGRVTICWRGDGAFLATNNLTAEYRRVIRVFSREAALESVSEPVDGLEGALSWKSSGEVIAGIQRLQDRIDVVFFERNGLRHGEFTLRLSEEEMQTFGSFISLSWNTDSTVLAVSFRDRIQFWTMGNYHYYLKQEVLLGSSDPARRPIGPKWHTSRQSKICLSALDRLLYFDLAFIVARGSSVPPHDHGLVAVIDGKHLKLTPFRHVVVPPPMAFFEIAADDNIVDFAISKSGQQLALLTTNGVEIHEWEFEHVDSQRAAPPVTRATPMYSKPLKKARKVMSIKLTDFRMDKATSRYTQIVTAADDEVVVLASKGSGRRHIALKPALPENDKANGHDPNSVLQNLGSVTVVTGRNFITDAHQTSVWASVWPDVEPISKANGAFTETVVRHEAQGMAFKLKGNCTHGTGLSLGVSLVRDRNENQHYHVIELDLSSNLAVDGKILTQHCTSFMLTEDYLLLTTSEHLLKFVHLDEPNQMTLPEDNPEVDERCRTIERGAKLVTVIPSTYSVVLQMPRGNLETIYPRILVVAGIRKLILNKDYKSAFLACQTHQVDMNILHDYRPDLFMQSIEPFISQLKKPSRIDEFLSKMKGEDVTQTLYKETKPFTEDLNGAGIQLKDSRDDHNNGMGKINRICDAFLSVLTFNSTKYLQSILTAHVRKHPPEVTAALSLISDLRRNSISNADMAIAHLCFLTDANRLYDAALGLYDLELALLVAQNSQRDPREYLPFLQSLHSLPEYRRQFQIDNHLKNHTKALAALHALEAHGELQGYLIKHSLYTNAMELYKYDSPRLRHISTLYAGYLASTSQHFAAATLFESLGDYNSAYPLYALAHRWRESLSCASLTSLPADQLLIHATGLATSLAEESRDYRSAATIHLDYLSDPITAARLLCRGSYFAYASRLLSLPQHNSNGSPPSLLAHQIPTIIHPLLLDKFSELLDLLTDSHTQIKAQVPRIFELRRLATSDPFSFLGGDPTISVADPSNYNGPEIPDTISLAPSDLSTRAGGGGSLFTRGGSHLSTRFGGTQYTANSRKTSKTRRREERKRARGKPGSVYEEEYLVGSVRRLVDRVNGVHEEVVRVVEGLLRMHSVGGAGEETLGQGMERARVLSELMAEVVAAGRDAVAKIWGDKDSIYSKTAELDGNTVRQLGVDEAVRPSGADGVFWDSRLEMEGLEAGGGQVQAPEVKEWIVNPLLMTG